YRLLLGTAADQLTVVVGERRRGGVGDDDAELDVAADRAGQGTGGGVAHDDGSPLRTRDGVPLRHGPRLTLDLQAHLAPTDGVADQGGGGRLRDGDADRVAGHRRVRDGAVGG